MPYAQMNEGLRLWVQKHVFEWKDDEILRENARLHLGGIWIFANNRKRRAIVTVLLLSNGFLTEKRRFSAYGTIS